MATPLAFDVLARDRGAINTLNKVGKAADGTGEKLKKMSKAGEESGGKFGLGFSKSIPGLGSRISGFFKTGLGNAGGAALIGGALLGGSLVTGFKSALDQGDVNAKFKAQLGLSGPDAATAGKISGDLFKANYGESVGQVNDAIRRVVQDTNVSLNSVDLKPVTAKVLDLATTFDQDLGGVTRGVGQLIRTGLAKNATEALDIVTKGFQAGVDKSEDFLDTLTEYGTQFRKLGLDGARATGILSQGLKAGARDADTVADALKEFSIRAIDGSKTTSDGFKQLGIDAEAMAAKIAKGGKPAAAGLDLVLDRLRNVKDPVEQSRIAVELFGTKAEDLGAALFALDPSSAVAALGQVAGAADKLDKTVGSTPSARIKSFFRTLKQNSVESLGGVITAFADGTTSASGFQRFLEDVAINTRRSFESIATAAKTVFDGLGKKLTDAIVPVDVSGIAESITSGAKGWAKSLIGGFKSGVEAGDWKPLGAAIGDAVIGLVNTSSTLGDKVGTTFKNLMNKINWKKVGEDSTSAIIGFIEGVKWGQVASALGRAALLSLKIDKTIYDSIINSAADLVTGIALELVRQLGRWYSWIFGKYKEVGAGLISGLWSGIKAGMSGVGKFLKSTIVDPVVGWVKSLFGIRSPSTVFAAIGHDLMAGLKVGLVDGFIGVSRWLGGLKASALRWIGDTTRTMYSKGAGFLQGMWAGLMDKWKNVTKWIGGLKASVSAWLGDTGSFLAGKGRAVLQGFWNGMTEKWSAVTKWVGGIAQWIKDNKGPVALDATLLIPAGRAIMDGFLKGLKSGAGPAWDFVKGVGGKTVSALQSVFGSLGGGGDPAPTNLSAMQALVRTVAAQRGWGSGPQWDALYNLIMGESGFNPNAQNPTSTAYGMFQFLNSTWGSVGATKTSDPWAQTIAGLRYIANNYGDPANAYAKWSSRSPHWYEKGTPWVPNDQLAFLHKGEGVIPADENRRLRASPRRFSSGEVAGTLVIIHKTPDGQELRRELLKLKRHLRAELGIS